MAFAAIAASNGGGGGVTLTVQDATIGLSAESLARALVAERARTLQATAAPAVRAVA